MHGGAVGGAATLAHTSFQVGFFVFSITPVRQRCAFQKFSSRYGSEVPERSCVAGVWDAMAQCEQQKDARRKEERREREREKRHEQEGSYETSDDGPRRLC